MNVLTDSFPEPLPRDLAAEIGSELEHEGPAVLEAFAALYAATPDPLLKTLVRFGLASANAKRARFRGDIEAALKFEKGAEIYYKALPANARW
jgi:hypothetical protein